MRLPARAKHIARRVESRISSMDKEAITPAVMFRWPYVSSLTFRSDSYVYYGAPLKQYIWRGNVCVEASVIEDVLLNAHTGTKDRTEDSWSALNEVIVLIRWTAALSMGIAYCHSKSLIRR